MPYGSLPKVRRSLLAVAFVLLAGSCLAQRRDGTYKASGGTGVAWSINDHQTLIWDGQPYLPIGIRIDGSADSVKAAKAAGVNDVIVDLPASGAGWNSVFEALNAAKMRFLIRVNSLAPMAKGFAIEPQGYRVSGISKKQTVHLELQGAKSAFVVLANKNDGQIVASSRVPVSNGQLVYDANPGAAIEHVLLVYPEMTSIEQPDFWDAMDAHRDSLLSSLKRNPAGAGLRGIVNPLGRCLSLPGREPRFVPTSSYFRMEFRNYLEDKYKNVEALLRTWSMKSSDLTVLDNQKRMTATFDQFARLIPLWTETRGVGAMLDPTTDKVYTCDQNRSKAWDDIAEVINAAGERRFRRFVPAIRSIDDVPVIQDWLGWAAPYETPRPIVDGIGMRAFGTSQSSLTDSGSRATSSILRWSSHGWLVTTDLDLGGSPDALSQLPLVLDDIGSLGAKGVFVHADTPALIKAVSEEAAKRSSDTSLSTSSPLPVFFPENAYNPAVPQRLPGGHWWLPCPADGDRIDLGSLFFAYRLKLDSGTVAIWTKKPGRYRLRFMTPRAPHFQTLDGSDPEAKVSKNAVEVTLTEFPLLITGTDELPIPEVSFIETVDRFKSMFAVGQKYWHDVDQEEFSFGDYVAGFDRNPGGCFNQLRRLYWKLGLKIAPYTWLEGERTSETNFSEVLKIPGCAASGALSLRTPVPPGAEGYYAVYPLAVKTKENQDVWMAAKIPAERRSDVSITVGGQVLRIEGEPVSLYGSGFGWYKMGTTRFAGSMSKLRVQVDTPGTSEIVIDTILVTPETFRPNGVNPPDPASFRAINIKQPTKKKGRKGSGAP